uniref:Uncharacterized protein n=1 Tax=Trichobilharzia regenti TaxID=157069 RepID=A0AA85JDX2_TRIRE|nr:unnamed protein product [Trichobilharzia regenti]
MCEPRDLAYWHEVFVLLTYSKSRAMAYRNAAVKEKAVIRNYDGMNIGFTEEIRYIDGSWDERTCLGVMKFNDPEGARHWLQSDHPFRQPDFLIKLTF